MSNLTLRHIIMGLVGLSILAFVNVNIFQTETRLTQGQVIFLQLAPVDPRSLMQGDYMQLNYALNNELSMLSDLPEKGQLVLKLDGQKVATFSRVYQGGDLAADEILLNYRRLEYGQVQIGPDSFFFQEGHADDYAEARYAALRVADNGQSLLVGLRSETLAPLGPSDN
ncbi:MAG: GDYXXLXY domain-containing protein [Anaerolineae bacterium]|nr:GDYXXLXY domain-containing protein [Anaerolineae bacterium]